MSITFPFARKQSVPALDAKIADLYSELAGHEAHTEEASNIIDQIVKLEKLRTETTKPWIPSPDATVAAVGSIASVILILNYEKLGAVTSKAIGFVSKFK